MCIRDRFRMSSPVEYPALNTTTDNTHTLLDQKSLTQPPPATSQQNPNQFSSNVSSLRGNPHSSRNNDASVFESTDTTSSSSATRQGATITDSPTTQGECSGLMSIDGAIPGMDDGLMNGLTELPDNFFAQLGSAPFGGGSLGSPKASSTINSAFDLSLIHISEPTRLLSISYAVFCLKKKKKKTTKTSPN
eukprot:TRINITY_DN3026_c0_g1_i2.p1 TRINITY_DN3026_c0_g1~~TRINITY_DN3026_c0_g1_i2.p1  ORF type:complete len:191 (+),score=43.84 TRINITY_DN3026_c0_g1_i2:174-746(+)